MSTIDTEQIRETDLLTKTYDDLNETQTKRKEAEEPARNPNVEALLLLKALLTKNTNLVEKPNEKIHTCPLTNEILNTIHFLNLNGLPVTVPKEGQKVLNLEEIATLKQEINNHLKETRADKKQTVLEESEPTTTQKTYEEHQFANSREKAKEIDPNLELFGVQTPKRQTVNLAHEFLHKAALPKLEQLKEVLEGHSVEIKDINKCREALLAIKKELVKYTEQEDKTKKHTLDDSILENIAFLESKNIKLLDHLEGRKELSLTELMELKEQIGSQTSKLQLDLTTLYTTKVGPDFNLRHIMLEIAKLVIRIDNQMMSALIQNQKVN
jgi:hypothetical protein